MTETQNHRELAAAVRQQVTAASAETDAALRQAALARAAGGGPLPEPYEALAHQIAEDSARVVDRQVAAVRESAGSDKAAFEVVMAAAIGAGLHRWDKAMEALDAAS